MQVYRPDIFKESRRKMNKLWLDKNENISEELLNFVKKNVKLNKEILCTYPNLTSTYEKISKFYKIDKYSILLSHGSDGGIQNIFQALVRKNSKIILSKPTFAMYDVYGKAFDANIFYVDYIINTKGQIELNLKKLFALLKKKPKLLCLPNPDSPTGSIMKENTLKRILQICKKNNCYVLIDEAYHLFYKSSQIKKIGSYKNLIITKSFSKAFGLAGIRAGCLIANKDTILFFKSFKQMYELNHYSSAILNEIFTKKGMKVVRNSVKLLNEGKQYFLKELKKMKLEYTLSYGNFIHVNLGKNKDKIIKELKKFCYFREKDTLLPLEGYSRFTLTNKKNFKRILSVIRRFFND
jgi:histidinol-phosphate aminotransferase